MKAIVTTAFGKPPEMRVEVRSQPLFKPGYSLIRMQAATINQLSKYIRQGDIPGLHTPIVLGNEGAGCVEHSERFAHGTRVGIYGGNKLGITEDGLFQEYVLVEDARLFALPDSLSWEEGATLSVNYLTAYRALTSAVQVKEKQTIVVSGATGGVGSAVVQVAKALGLMTIAIVSTDEKARVAGGAGADDAISLASESDVPAAIRALTGGKGADFAFDPVGGNLFGMLMQGLAFRGTLVSLGFTGGNEPVLNALDLIAAEKRIVGYSLHAESDEEMVRALAELVQLASDGKLKPVIDSTVSLAQFEEGYARLVSRQAVGAIVLRFDKQ